MVFTPMILRLFSFNPPTLGTEMSEGNCCHCAFLIRNGVNTLYNYFEHICCFCCSEPDIDDSDNYDAMKDSNINVAISTKNNTPSVSLDNIYKNYSLSDEDNYNVVYNQLYKQ